MAKKDVTCLESTFRLRWKITKEEFDKRANVKMSESEWIREEWILQTAHCVKLGDQEIDLKMSIYPRGGSEQQRDKVGVYLRMAPRYCSYGIYGKADAKKKIYNSKFACMVETPSGYWPEDFSANLFSRQDGGFGVEFGKDGFWSYGDHLGSTKEFCKQFVDNKMTIVVTLVIVNDVEGNVYQDHMEATDDFIKDMRSKAVLDHDFTIICSGKQSPEPEEGTNRGPKRKGGRTGKGVKRKRDETDVGPEQKRYPCHKYLLSLRSKFFKAMFLHDKNKTDIEICDSSPEIVEKLLKFMSDGLIPEDIDEIAMELIPVADKYGPESLTKICVNSLMENLSPENAVETLVLIDRHSHSLRQKVLDFITKEAAKIVNSKDWDQFAQNFPALVKDIILAMAKTAPAAEKKKEEGY